MNIFQNEEAPKWMLECLGRLQDAFGSISLKRSDAYVRVLMRRDHHERHLRRAVDLAEDRWDRWQSPANLLKLCGEAREGQNHFRPRAFESEDESREKRRLMIEDSRRAWFSILERARAAGDPDYTLTAEKEIDRCDRHLRRMESRYVEADLVNSLTGERGFPNAISDAARAEMDAKCRARWPDDPNHERVTLHVTADLFGTDRRDAHYYDES